MLNLSKIIEINPLNPQPDLISEAARVIKNGGIVLFPTRYLYGLGADALNSEAVDRVFAIKQRPSNKPLSVLINHQNDLSWLVRNVPQAAVKIMESFWPGDITIVFEANATLPRNLTAGSGKIGVRLPQHPVAVALTNAVQVPITATSANLTGRGGCSRVTDLDPLVADKLDLMLDAGPLEGGTGSTVIDVTVDVPKILREGAVPAKDIFAILD
ncbi:MAG: threonylcarbamoyl-AMP synthase [Desulfobacteraceae bacterium]|nr:threonylcarbamoyl-AMP synthase [Desulfobacteraceae bacterium]